MQRRRLSASLAVAAALTILSGATMYWRIATDMHDAWVRSRPGIVLGFGGLTALIAFALGGGVAAPTARKLEALSRDAPRSILERLQSRLSRVSCAIAVLLVITATCMAIARYL
jgi:hypothetical protein